MNGYGDPNLCPEPDVLQRLVEGTSGVIEASIVVRHLDICPDCRFILQETRVLLTELATEAKLPPKRGRRARWLAIAATIAIAVLASQLLRAPDPASQFDLALARSRARPTAGRLANMEYRPFLTRRGKTAVLSPNLRASAELVAALQPRNAQEWNRRGRALLVNLHHEQAIPAFVRATLLEPTQARYWNDLAVARIATGLAKGDASTLAAATADASHALQLSPGLSEAQFNLAFALDCRGLHNDALSAYQAYIALDPDSRWATEVRERSSHLH
jgi:tetratricopeptide (TPR) repeat protein